MKQKIFIIEHLEGEIYEWCLIEYKHISEIVGKENLWFTNISEKEAHKLEKFGKVITKSVKTMNLKNICILDPEAKKMLTTKEASNIDYFLFGGILGDYPPRKRTKEELTPFIKAKAFNIGKKQMSTDNAIYTVKKIIDGEDFKNLKFKDKIEIKINEIESTILPYRYNLVNGKPLISKDLLNYLKKE